MPSLFQKQNYYTKTDIKVFCSCPVLLDFLTSFHVLSAIYWSSHPELFLGKGVLNICSKFTGDHPCQSAISIKLQSNFIEITLWYGCSPVNLLHNFRTPFPKNTPGWLLLYLG